MTITGISSNVQALLTATDLFVSVLPHEPQKDNDFAGYPSAAHYYRNTESNYATVSQNRRVIEYVVELYLITNEDTDPSAEMVEAYSLIDNVIQLFDESVDLSSTSLSLARACDIMRAVPGTLQPISSNEGTGWMGVITLFCEADIQFSY